MISNKSLYIHIPFCKKKCIYCDFFSVEKDKEFIEKYIDYLIREMKFFYGEKIRTIFIGGGTPSILSISDLKKLFLAIKNNFNLKDLEEFTIETNPESLDNEKLDFFIKNEFIKISRISLGLQAFNNNILKKIGRLYLFEEFLEKIYKIKNFGFKNLNIDLILGFSNIYNDKNFIRNFVEFLENVKPEHISIYMLMIAEKTKLFSLIDNGELKKPLDEDILNDYSIILDILKNSNFLHYEISNFAYSKKNICLHNLAYWQRKEYIGLGAGASGFLGGVRYKNFTDFKKYFFMIDTNDINFKEIESLTDLENLEEEIFLNLRLLQIGLNIDKLENKFLNFNFSKFRKKIKNFIFDGYLEKKKENIFLTRKGIFGSNQIFSDLIDF